MTIRHILLVLTLRIFDSETGTGAIVFQFSSDLVSALAEIHLECDARTLKNLQQSYTPQVGHSVSQQFFVHTYRKCNFFFPRLHDFLGAARRLRKARKLARRKQHAILAKSRYRGCKFDSTLGFPGEGWWKRFTVATWNTRSLTKERFEYAKSLGYDVLAITELWRNQSTYQTRRKNFIVSEPILIKKGPNKGKIRFPNDRAAGVGILLSDRMEQKVHSFGSRGERICWVRLQGPVCNLFVVAVYLPHRAKIAPTQDQTLTQVQELLSEIPSRDCVCLLGDFNEQLAPNVDGITGAWTGSKPSKNSDKIISLLRLYNLTAMNTMFRPKKHQTVHTFLQTKRKEGDVHDDKYIGRSVKVKYNRRWTTGKVIAPSLISTEPAWIVRFEDGYIATYNEKQLAKILIHIQSEKTGHQLDYIFVSRRWKSCVRKCSVNWAPSRHRNLHGDKDDHGLLASTWTWRIRCVKQTSIKDFGKLTEIKLDDDGKPLPNATLTAFDEAVKRNIQEQGCPHDADATTLHQHMQSAIQHAINSVLPDVPKTTGVRRDVSERSKSLYKKREKMRGCNQAQYDGLQKAIRESRLRDFQEWVEKHSQKMQEANGHGDVKKIFKSVNELAGERQKPPKNLTTNGQGGMLNSAQDVASRWYNFLVDKFAATAAECERPPMQGLPPTVGQDPLSTEEILDGLRRMNSGKATGPDGIPIEVFKHSKVCKTLLVALIKKIWLEEIVPAEFGEAKFVMIFKNKGSHDDPSKYRCLGMLNHTYKVLSQCMLNRMVKETEGFLPDWQAGFRSKRGCRDNILVLRTLYDAMLERGEPLYVTFIDYSAAFDSVSHKFLDEALHAAGASNKTRAMFRAIYRAATARTAVQGTDGKTVFSDVFPINRGVVQGDITSPWYFILALELILRRHDADERKGVMLLNKNIHSLGYADDAALVDNNLAVATDRVTNIAQGSRQDADMSINIAKTEVMHVCEQGAVSRTTDAEAKKVCKHKCKYPGCNKVFRNAHGVKCHQGKCRWKHEYVMDKILAVSGLPTSSNCRYKVRWHGYGAEDDTWEPHSHLPPQAVKSFLKRNGLYDYNWPSDSRCQYCDKPCKSPHGAKIHMHKCHHRPDKQSFAGTCADRCVKDVKVAEAQKHKPKVKCEQAELKNVAVFKYLGSLFYADGQHRQDVTRRIALAMNRCGKLRHVFDSKDLPMSLKLSVYKAAVASILTYGSEAWHLTTRTQARLNGANARCLSRFTGKSSHEEASKYKRTYDLVSAVRSRRYKWLGHILRLPGPRLVKVAVQAQYEMGLSGNICMDAPHTSCFEELTQLAQDRAGWAKHWRDMQLCNETSLPPIPMTISPTTTPTQATTTTPTTTNPARSKPVSTMSRQDLSHMQAAAWQAIFTKSADIHSTTETTELPTAPRHSQSIALAVPDIPRASYPHAAQNDNSNISHTTNHNSITSNNPLWTAPAQIPSDIDTPTPSDSLWTRPALIPSDIDTPSKTDSSWAIPAQLPSDINTPTSNRSLWDATERPPYNEPISPDHIYPSLSQLSPIEMIPPHIYSLTISPIPINPHSQYMMNNITLTNNMNDTYTHTD